MDELLKQEAFDKLITEFVKSIGLADYDYGQGGTLETYQSMRKRVIAAYAAALARIASLEEKLSKAHGMAVWILSEPCTLIDSGDREDIEYICKISAEPLPPAPE